MPGQKEDEKASIPVRRPSADLRLCVRPRTSIKIREYFHTLGGAATLKLGADYVFDASKPEMHNLQIRTSLKDTLANAKILYSAGEVTLAKTLWLDGRTRVNLWNEMMLANTPVGVQLDSCLEFFPHVAYSTSDKKVGIGTLRACLEQLNIVLYLNTSNVIPKSLLSNKILSPVGYVEESGPSRLAEKGWQDVKKGSEDIWADARKRSKKGKAYALKKSEQTITIARKRMREFSIRAPKFHPVQALMSWFNLF
ncbi:hypothetical protein NDN08_005830 [Rhodosorus marinus]|uniref:Uncharacterized protein n=1 Tax=Rhodosorus marinus TaxID=101924 RepID=A0AAV8V4E2_9RHOD|nr:hypothetical protein NDN08_005830 [Rhodosorus marinus]